MSVPGIYHELRKQVRPWVLFLDCFSPRGLALLLLQVTQIMVPLLKFYFHEEVRQAAVQAVPELLKSVHMAVSEGKANGADMQYVKQMLDYVWQPLIDSMIKVRPRH